MSKYGHVTGTKREKPGASTWYQAIEEATLREVERRWEERAAIEMVLRDIPRHLREQEEDEE